MNIFFIADCFEKPLYRHQERLNDLGVSVYPDFVVDDHTEPVEAFGGAVIRPPHSPLDSDREMLRVYESIQAFTAVRLGQSIPRDDGDAPQ